MAGLCKTVGRELGHCCMLMCVESVYVVGGCSVVVLGLYGMFGALSCEILLLLNVTESDMGCLLCGRLWSEQC